MYDGPPPKIALNVSCRIGTGADLVMSWARPNAIPSMASVTRNDGMPRNVTRLPLTMPTTSPTARPASTPKSALPVAEMTLARLIEHNHLGMRTGRGFYDWTERDPIKFRRRRDREIIRRLKILREEEGA